MRKYFTAALILSAFVGSTLAVTWPDRALASTFEQPINQKLGNGTTFGRWPNGVVSYVYNPTDVPAVFADNAYFVGLLQDAMAELEGVSGLTFVYQGIDSDVVLNDFTDGVVAVGWENIGARPERQVRVAVAQDRTRSTLATASTSTGGFGSTLSPRGMQALRILQSAILSRSRCTS